MGNHLNFFYLLIFALCLKMRSILEIIRWAADKNVLFHSCQENLLRSFQFWNLLMLLLNLPYWCLAVYWNHLLWFRAQRKGAPQVCAEPNPLPSSIPMLVNKIQPILRAEHSVLLFKTNWVKGEERRGERIVKTWKHIFSRDKSLNKSASLMIYPLSIFFLVTIHVLPQVFNETLLICSFQSI